MEQEINCEFIISKLRFHGETYVCIVNNITLLKNAELKFIGDHLEGKSHLDVEGLKFQNCAVTKIPQKLTKTFPNLKVLYFMKSKLKQIERADFKDLYLLKNLVLFDNKIEFLPSNIFNDMKHLETISFSQNRIQIIEPSLLDGLNNLKYVNLRNNTCISKCFDSITHSGDSTLEEIKQEISNNFSTFISTLSPQSLIIYKKFIDLRLKYEAGICNDLQHVILDENFKDFTVKVGDEEFKVHKFLMAARSPVLAETIRNNIDAEELNLVDISAEVFREILNFMYTDELPTSDDIDFVHLYGASEKFKIARLQHFAAEKLVNKVNVENAIEMMILSNKFQLEGLRQKSFEQTKIILGDECIDEDLTKQTDKLKKILDLKIMKDKIDADMKALMKKN